ncbi:BlaI/MecI/CopY family transcriptional regulator [Anaerostipes sp.]|uniref:BlaI/MecI/CopY family transcriptional regulator n=1 Tax=Anaerostipes sp. TaxID=1872530 RepID=UPI0025C5A0A8|nr:BlaI/MecI/CopY family transcriptional regulator [Anaerostipes sp.]MBS7007281.1 BlaI/MecI/CopY family transcriptional regulator [Anaerostipes sp.]
MGYKKLTQSQLNIMKTLWNTDHAMVASDFVKINPSQNLNSVQSALRALLKKGYIQVSEIVYSGKVLTRSYIPVISAEDYVTDSCSDLLTDYLSTNIISNFIEKEEDMETLERLQSMLQKRRDELEGR